MNENCRLQTLSASQLSDCWAEKEAQKETGRQDDSLKRIILAAYEMVDGSINSEIDYPDIVRDSSDLLSMLLVYAAPDLATAIEWLGRLEREDWL